MEIRVYGLGYVGLVTALGLSKEGHSITGIEVSREKVEQLQSSKLHIYEPGLEEWFSSSREKSSFTFSSSSKSSDSEEMVAMVCVGTPMGARGKVDLSQLKSVLESILADLKNSSTKRLLLVIRSTIPPGTSLKEVLPILNQIKDLGKLEEVDYIFYPEFLREGQATQDFEKPKVSVMGTFSNFKKVQKNWETFLKILPVGSHTNWVSVNTAEMMKYAQNSYNALRVTFANELATVASQYDVDSGELYNLMKSNLSNEKSGQYLNPGFSYGGPCLVKEVEALSWMGRKSGHVLPLISSISRSNQNHYERFLSIVQQEKAKRVVICGVAFKPDTDDLRNSFIVKLVDDLLDGPSYKSEVFITILEKEAALEKVSSYWANEKGVIVKNAEHVIEREHDLVVFGSLKPNNEVIKSLDQNCKKSINLGFFDQAADFNF
jgi:GDP-mannose 6-dehydrogenase